MKKSNIVLLNKNGKVKVIKKESDIINHDCKYILVPMLEYEANTFIMIKPKKLLDFTSVYVEVSLQIKRFGEDSPCIEEFAVIKKTLTTIVDFINFIHSIDRIDYVNTITNSDVEYDYTEIIDIQKMSIIMVKDNQVTYKYNFRSQYGEGYSNKSNCEIVILELSDVYQLKNADMQSYKTNGFINIRNNYWSFDKHPDKNSIIGVNLILSQTIFFTEYDTYKLFDYCDSLRCEAYVFNKDNIDPIIQDCEIPDAIEDGSVQVYSGSQNNMTFGFIEKDHISMMEFIIYFKLIYMIVLMKYNMILFGVNLDPKAIHGFDMYLDLKIISQYNKELRVDILKENIPSFDDMIKKFYITWSELL